MMAILRGLLICCVTLLSSPVMADGLPDARPEQLVASWLKILFSGDAPAIEAILADHFQVVMASGDSFNKAQTPGVLPVATSEAKVSDIVITRSDDIIVARYNVEIDQKILGKAQSRLAPRLTVFERHADGWYVTAHANFAVPTAD